MKKRVKKESHTLGKILKKIAPEIGATVFLEPEWKITGQITFKSGARSYFRFNTLDLNPMGSSEVAKDKDYANFFIQKLGYPIIPGSKSFYSPTWAEAIGAPKRSVEAAIAHAEKIGFPVVVKPNGGSQGRGVARVEKKSGMRRALTEAFAFDRVALVQKAVTGKDYRLVVLDDEIISAYERVPLNVIGDGRTTIKGLLKKKQKAFEKLRRDTIIRLDDPRMLKKLKQYGYTLDTKLKKSEQLFLLDNANLSSGGDSIDVLTEVHEDFKKLAIQLTKDMGLRLCGVDLMVDDDISDSTSPHWIIEINSAPGLDNYVTMGRKQKKIVEELYRKVLKSMER